MLTAVSRMALRSTTAEAAPLTRLMATAAAKKKPVRVAVTGAAGAIAYSLLFRIAHGDMLGKDQPVILHMVDLPAALDKMKGVAMELQDCAFPALHDIVMTDKLEDGFKDIDYAMLVGAKPRGPGMERADLMKSNAEIFSVQGKALNKYASRSCKTIVVGNPANTNCLIAASNAPDMDANNFSAMTRLDHNRALAMLSKKLDCTVDEIERFAIWGNHSSTMYPDVSHTTVKGDAVKGKLDQAWLTGTFIPEVAQRGAAIIKARGASSAASAASAAVDHIRDWALGSSGKWVSMAIPSDGSYGIEPGVYYSVPVTTAAGSFKRVSGLSVDAFSRERMDKTKKELFEEREMVKHLLGENKQLKA